MHEGGSRFRAGVDARAGRREPGGRPEAGARIGAATGLVGGRIGVPGGVTRIDRVGDPRTLMSGMRVILNAAP